MSENDQGMKVEVEGQGTVEEPQAVAYDAGAETPAENTMEGLSEASDEEQSGEVPQQGEEPQSEPENEMEAMVTEEAPAPSTGIIDETKTIEEPTLSQSSKPGFDTASTQPALSDSDDEGGVAKSTSTGGQKNFRGAETEGTLIKPNPDMTAESKAGTYEMSGFTVSYEPKKGEGTTSVQIRDVFPDMETAMASVNGNKYLMPMPQGGFKIATIIQGAPAIVFEDRQVYEYVNGKWRRA